MENQCSDSEDSSDYGSKEAERPNRWTGASSTWLSLTEHERGIQQSLLELRNRDLSIHLYNAFNLKKRAQKLNELREKAKSPRSGEAFSDEYDSQDADAEGKVWSPPRVWTAWPLPPDLVPREGEHVGPEDEDEVYTLKRRDKEWPSRELEEVLIGTALKRAKENWEKRPWADSWVEEEMDTDGELEAAKKAETEELPDAPRGDVNMDDPAAIHEPIIKEQSQQPQEVFLTPVISADDDRARYLLRPSIRHMLSKLDDTLMALHHACEICRQHSIKSENNSEDDGLSSSAEGAAQDSSLPAKRPRGRPRKFDITSRPKAASGLVQGEGELSRSRDTSRSKAGRPRKAKKVYDRLDGETEHDYQVRIAKHQKKPLPSFAPPRETETPELSASSRGREEKQPVRQRVDLGLRDWSEVLGAAALVGFHPDVIARATQRCATIFGEGMKMRFLVETPRETKDADVLTTYRPEEIPDLGSESAPSSEDSGDDWNLKRDPARKPKKYRPGLNNYPCPIDGCARKIQGFVYISGLSRHLKKSHRMTDDEVDSLLDNDEEMHGAVHVDGFLKPLRNERGVRGQDKAPRKRREMNNGRGGNKKQTDQSSSDDENDDENDESGEKLSASARSSERDSMES
jgi:hypothetical protein